MTLLKTINRFAIVAILLLVACTDDDDASLVNFSTPEIEVATEELSPSKIDLDITPPASVQSVVSIIAPRNAYGNLFITEPPIVAGQIDVSIAPGDSAASFEIIPLVEGIGFNDFQQEFEIIFVGPGLTTNEFAGRYLNYKLINERVQGDELPYIETFGVCSFGGSGELPPEGWEIVDVVQNSFGTGGFFCYTGQGATGVGTNPFSPDGATTSGDDYSESWLVSPKISLANEENPELSFDFDRRFDAPINANTLAYSLQISTDYDGTNFETANWEVFQPAVDAMTANNPNFDDISTIGPLDLSSYEGDEISIAFVYRAADAYFQATSIRVTNVKVE